MRLANDKVFELANRLTAAFREVHALALQQHNSGSALSLGNTQYPRMGIHSESGMPSMYDHGLYRSNAPPDHGAVLFQGGFFSVPLSRFKKEDLRQVYSLANFLSEKGLVNGPHDLSAELEAKTLTAHAVSRYLSLYGKAPLDGKLPKLLTPFIDAIVWPQLPLLLVVPICLTRFEVDRFRLDGENFILKISKEVQLGRSLLRDHSGGTASSVAQAATHAFVSSNWRIENDGADVERSLSAPTPEIFEYIDTLFASLRAASGVSTGYAQVLFLARKWSFRSRWDLPYVYGSTHRRYPNSFDNWGWARQDLPLVTADQLREVRRTFTLIKRNDHNRIAIAIKRLNACLNRDDDVDALLDAIIGLEVLLGEGTDALSYKLKMRTAGLAKLSKGRFQPAEAFRDMGELYKARSRIVHGHTAKPKSGDVAATSRAHAEHRQLATTYLRQVLDVLLENPRYLEPKLIDDELLMWPPVTSELSAEEER